MKFKNGVNPFGIKNELLAAIFVIDAVYRRFGQELVVTSINDGKHSHASLHYAGQAADLRTHYFSDAEQVEDVAAQIRKALGENPDYDVVVESDHIHIEYQPKRRT